MEDYLEAWVVVIILFAAGLISAAIVYYAIQIIGSIITRNTTAEETQSLIGFIAWPFALLTWAIVDYFLFDFLRHHYIVSKSISPASYIKLDFLSFYA